MKQVEKSSCLKSLDAVVDATIQYDIDEVARKRVAVKRICGDGAGKLGRSVKFLKMLAEKDIK